MKIDAVQNEWGTVGFLTSKCRFVKKQVSENKTLEVYYLSRLPNCTLIVDGFHLIAFERGFTYLRINRGHNCSRALQRKHEHEFKWLFQCQTSTSKLTLYNHEIELIVNQLKFCPSTMKTFEKLLKVKEHCTLYVLSYLSTWQICIKTVFKINIQIIPIILIVQSLISSIRYMRLIGKHETTITPKKVIRHKIVYFCSTQLIFLSLLRVDL